MRYGMRRQDWAFLAAIAAGVLAVAVALRGELAWAGAWAVAAICAGAAARAWSRKYPGPMPYLIRWVLLLPRGLQSAERLKVILQPRRGERVLEIGPGIGIHAVPIASSLRPDGVLEVFDVQQEMLDDLMRRAMRAGVDNIKAKQGDAQKLPYPDRIFDAAYLIGVLGEVPDEAAALRELRRVLKDDGRLVVGEIAADPDFISLRTLREKTADAGFVFEQKHGPGFVYFARFRPVDAPTDQTARASTIR